MSTQPFVAYVENILGAAGRALGVPVLYKGKEGREALPGLSADCHAHGEAFCLRVKSDPGRYKKCQDFYAERDWLRLVRGNQLVSLATLERFKPVFPF